MLIVYVIESGEGGGRCLSIGRRVGFCYYCLVFFECEGIRERGCEVEGWWMLREFGIWMEECREGWKILENDKRVMF